MSDPLSSQPIGLLDSGVGGLTIASAIKLQMPNESIVYYGDTAHLPYGNKSKSFIQNRTLEIVDWLSQQHCKLIVIACNSASAYASQWLKTQRPNLRLCDVIQPTIKHLEQQSLSVNKIGIIGTHATIHSQAYSTAATCDLRPKISAYATPLLAPMIEENASESLIIATLNQYLNDPLLQDIDQLVLACTHYPLISNLIQKVIPSSVDLVDSPAIIASHIQQLLAKLGLLNPDHNPQHQITMSDKTTHFANLAKQFFNEAILVETEYLST